MVNNTRINELQEKMLKAMDIVNAQALSSVSYDKTITCTIENDANAKEGKYEVSDGSKIFDAYSSDVSLKKGDKVYIIIPEGNFENQKMILGKKTSKTEKPFVYNSPFDNFFAMTDNLATGLEQGSIVANKVISENLIDTGDGKVKKLLLEVDTSDKNIIKYTRLGIGAEFRSWIKSAVEGFYGLEIELQTSKPGVVSSETIESTYIYWLDSSTMYGNPYSFETWYSQELVINLSDQDIGKVNKIKIYLYQDVVEKEDGSKEGSFKDNQSKLLDYKLITSNGVEMPMLPNIFVQNLIVKFGYDASKFTTDYVEIYTQNRYTYKASTDSSNNNIEENRKELKMRWVHVKDGTPFDMVYNEENRKKGIKFSIRWYKYKVGAPAADEYSSVFWENIAESNEENPEFAYTFDPDVNNQYERIKAIIICDGIPFRSNELIFENENALPPSNEAWAIMNALAIETDDGTNGNYMLYGQDNKLKDSKHSKVIRTLTPYFDIDLDGQINKGTELITDLNHLTWYFPTSNTMIKLLSSGNYEFINLINYEKGKYYIQVALDEAEGDKYTYEISNEDFDPSQTYYTQDSTGTYIKVDNFYQENKYYLFKYINCNETSTFDNQQDYYVKEDEIYKIVKNLTIDEFNKDKTKYYILDYEKDSSPDFDINKEYHFLNPKSGVVSGALPRYQIESYYSSGKTNNTVTCEYHLNGVVYKTEKEFTFGPSGTMGTEQTLVIDFVGDKNAILANTKSLEVELQLYDNQNQQIDISQEEVKWSWYYNSDFEAKTGISIPNGIIGSYRLTIDNYTANANGFAQNSLYILQAELGKLKTYFSIPIRASEEYSYITGASQVIYTTTGEPLYSKEAYNLYKTDQTFVENLKWEIYTDKIDLKEEKYLGTITVQKNKNKEKYILAPLSIYVKDAPVYGVQAVVNIGNKNDVTEKIVLWTQPILVMQNKWPNATINAWDGNSLVLNAEKNHILTAAIAAGKKNSDNTFSGVMLGDWKGTDTEFDIADQTGIFGFHEGAVSYALTEDGRAFFGQEGKGRIYLDGDKAILQSAYYDDNENPYGMQIDLDEPYIKMKNTDNNYINMVFTGSKNDDIENRYPEIKIASADSNITLSAKDSGSTIKMTRDPEETGEDDEPLKHITITNVGDTPLKIGSSLSVAWDGTLKASNGNFSGTITSSSGTIGGWNINPGLLNSSKISLNSTANTISVGGAILNGSDNSITGAIIKGSTITADNIYITLPKEEISSSFTYYIWTRNSVDDPWPTDYTIEEFDEHPNMYEPPTAITDDEATTKRMLVEIEEEIPVQQGYIGYIEGNNGVTQTTGVGIRTYSYENDPTTNPIIFESAADIKLGAKDGIWIYSNNNESNGYGRLIMTGDHVGLGYENSGYLSIGEYEEDGNTYTSYVRIGGADGVRIDTYGGIGRLVLNKEHAGLGFAENAYLSMGEKVKIDGIDYHSVRLSGDGPIKIDSFGNSGGRFVADKSHVGIGFGNNSSNVDTFGGNSFIALYEDHVTIGAKKKLNNGSTNSGDLKLQAEKILFVPSGVESPSGYGRIVSADDHIGLGFGDTTGNNPNTWVALYEDTVTIGAQTADDFTSTYSGEVKVQAKTFTVTGPSKAATRALLSEEGNAELMADEANGEMTINTGNVSISAVNTIQMTTTEVNGTITANELVISGPVTFSGGADQQTGIYARFA